LHVDAEEVADGAEVLDSERGPEVADDLGDELAASGRQDHVLDVQEQVHSVIAAAVDEQRRVGA